MSTSGSRLQVVWSEQERSLEIQCWFCANMLDPALPIFTKLIESQTVRHPVYFPHQTAAQSSPLLRIDLALKNGILDPLAKVETSPSDATEASAPGSGFSIYIIGDQDQHRKPALLPDETWIPVQITPQMAGEQLRLKVGHQSQRRHFSEKGMSQFVTLAFLPGH